MPLPMQCDLPIPLTAVMLVDAAHSAFAITSCSGVILSILRFIGQAKMIRMNASLETCPSMIKQHAYRNRTHHLLIDEPVGVKPLALHAELAIAIIVGCASPQPTLIGCEARHFYLGPQPLLDRASHPAPFPTEVLLPTNNAGTASRDESRLADSHRGSAHGC